MPSELGPFFKHILDSVDSFYRGKTAETLRLSLAADEANGGFSMPFSLYYFHDKEYDEPGFALRMPIEPKPEANTAMHMRQRVHRRLNGICKGLLELNGNFVGYLHRTVRDWLRDPEMQQYLREKSAPAFNPFEAILSACLAGIKSTRFTDGILTRRDGLAYTWHGKLNHRLREALSYVSYAETAGHSGAQIVPIVDCLGDSVERLFAVNGAQFSLWTEAPARNPKMMFRQHLLEARLWGYISVKLRDDPGFFAQYPATPFYAMLRDDSLASHSRMVWTRERVELVNGVLAEEQRIASGRSYDGASAVRVIWALLVRDCLPENLVDVETKPMAENLRSFKSALEFGIMSKLASRLQLSTEICVARTALAFIPSWFGLILLLLKCENLSSQQKEESIRVLEKVLGSPSTNVASSMSTLWDVLCTYLQHREERIAGHNAAQEEFLARILFLILVNAEKQWAASTDIVPPRKLLKSTISNCFSEACANHLLSIFGPSEEGTGTGITGKKKRRDHDEVTGGRSRKRGKCLINNC